MSEKNKKKLQSQLAELDALLAWFEQDDFDIESALTKYETGMKLIDDIEQRLKHTENKITILKQRFDQTNA